MRPPNGRIRFIVGIDEAGRGPLAGPVSVGGVVIVANHKHELLKGAKDSKLLPEKSREEWFKKIKEAKKSGSLDYAVSLVSAEIIDRKGIVFAVRKGIQRVLRRLEVPPHETLVLLDGSLYAPEQFIYQETIIGGDRKVPLISLASIAAKVTRDRRMVRLSKKYPEYDFHIHKGYGTLSHRKKIKKNGPSEIHRKSFLRGIVDQT